MVQMTAGTSSLTGTSRRNRLLTVGAIGLMGVFLWYADTHFSPYTIRILNNIAIFITLAVSYNLINGVAGQFSLRAQRISSYWGVYKRDIDLVNRGKDPVFYHRTNDLAYIGDDGIFPHIADAGRPNRGPGCIFDGHSSF